MLACSSGLLVGLATAPKNLFYLSAWKHHPAWAYRAAAQQGPREIQALWKSNGLEKVEFFAVGLKKLLDIFVSQDTEMFCFEKLGVFLLLGLMLLCHPKSKHQCFCSPQDAFPTFRVSRCHLWVCWLGGIRRKPTPHLVVPCGRTDATSDFCLLPETVSIAGWVSQLIYLATGKLAHLFVCFHLLVLWWGIWPSGARTVSDYNNYKVFRWLWEGYFTAIKPKWSLGFP